MARNNLDIFFTTKTVLTSLDVNKRMACKCVTVGTMMAIQPRSGQLAHSTLLPAATVRGLLHMHFISWLSKTYSFLYFTPEDMYSEEFCIIMTFCESKTVTFRSSIMPADAEEDLVDGVVGYFSVCLRI